MHMINVHIDENISLTEMAELRHKLLSDPHVRNVELHDTTPHDMLVEFEEHHDVPIHVLDILKGHGLHPDIVGC